MSTYATPTPGVAQYGQAALLAKTAYQQALARLNQKRQGTLRQFGYQGDIDPETGTVKNVRTDGNNPYGLFQMNNRTQARGLDQAAWNAQERGLGTGGGLAAQMQNDLRFQYGAQDAQMGQDLVGSLAEYQDAQTSAAQQRDAALYQAELEAARMAIQAEQWNPADYAGLDYPDYGAGDSQVAVAIKKTAPKPAAKKPPAYNPAAYVPGGSSVKVATAIQKAGYKPLLPKKPTTKKGR